MLRSLETQEVIVHPKYSLPLVSSHRRVSFLPTSRNRGVALLTFHAAIVMLILSVTAILAGCGGGGSAATTQNQTPTTYTIGGSVSGLTGSGLVLQNSGGNNLSVTANGNFTFSTAITSGAAYSVTVQTQPSNPTQNCMVTNGSGTANANVTNVQVSCTTQYTIGGSVSGLSGSGLVLQNNGVNNLTIIANGSFTFTAAVASGSTYSVTVQTQPSNPTQTCSVTNATGTANGNVTNVQVACVTPVPTYTIGGTVTGLSGGGLVLQDNGGNNLSVSADGGFTFTTAITSGNLYDVTVLTQPSKPAQSCMVTNGSNTATANVTNVAVVCTVTNAPAWAWMAGASTNDTDGTYGTEGTAAAANSPGSRSYSTAWTDRSGNLWLFGGNGYDSAGTFAFSGLNDLWKWNGTEWTWEGGSNLAGQQGVYGTEGTAAANNVPGHRSNAVGWTDPSGNFWLFGGNGTPFGGTTDLYNDLWKYSSGEWTWVSGSDGFNNVGTYGTEGTAAAANVPGSRSSSDTWTDQSGNLWLFGGSGYDSVGTNGGSINMNDLWKFSASSSQWTWVGGSNVGGKSGVYGTLGTAAAGNMPGARIASCTWTDKAGNFWMFGGSGYDSAGTNGYLNDLWKYNPGNGQWTWVSGSNLAAQQSVYGTEGTTAATNSPGSRARAACWMDAAGNFWIYGGLGTTPVGSGINFFDDLWEYSAGEWTWVGGSSTAALPGTWGTEGTPAAGNLPGARYPAASWTDASGNFWLFGGFGEFQTNVASNLNDMWEFIP
jgi:hypothetical protein